MPRYIVTGLERRQLGRASDSADAPAPAPAPVRVLAPVPVMKPVAFNPYAAYMHAVPKESHVRMMLGKSSFVGRRAIPP